MTVDDLLATLEEASVVYKFYDDNRYFFFTSTKFEIIEGNGFQRPWEKSEKRTYVGPLDAKWNSFGPFRRLWNEIYEQRYWKRCEPNLREVASVVHSILIPLGWKIYTVAKGEPIENARALVEREDIHEMIDYDS
jgi:hypothetical protein